MRGCARIKKSGLGVEQAWDAREVANLEAKVFGEKGTNGPEIVLASE